SLIHIRPEIALHQFASGQLADAQMRLGRILEESMDDALHFAIGIAVDQAGGSFDVTTMPQFKPLLRARFVILIDTKTRHFVGIQRSTNSQELATGFRTD